MGNTPSNFTNSNEYTDDIWWNRCENSVETAEVSNDPIPNNYDEFKEEFDRKRERRKIILEEKRKEIQNIRNELRILKEENERLKNSKTVPQNFKDEQLEFLLKQNETLKQELVLIKEKEDNSSNLSEKNRELRMNLSEMQEELQRLNSCVLDFEQEKDDYKRHVKALKDVIKVSKELISIRETEVIQLKEKMKAIETALNERETSIMSDELRREYERQLANIRALRELYEERSRTYRRETTLLKSTLDDKEKEIEESTKKINELQERLNELEKDNSDKYDTIKTLESSLGLSKAECRQYQAELEVINQLFSHILLTFNNSRELDLDKLLKQLEEHHDLLKEIVNNEISSEVSSALPKVLLDLVNQISCDKVQSEAPNATFSEDVSSGLLNSPAEIAENLPKVWKVLIELLSHQTNSYNNSEEDDSEEENKCFKTVVTSKGPSLVLSVSKTFFRLKELIIEKKMLEKDMNNLKQLNCHLESRLQDQEKRFEVVSSELTKTWNFVGKLQKEHKLLHTQEKILRYELAQKRKLLKDLKEELEYSREKWQEAREKNSKTEKEWLILRKEFASRKIKTNNDDGCNSVESGYSDEKECLSDEEPGYETDISECKADENCEEDAEILESTVIEKDETEVPDILNVIKNEITEITNELPIPLSETTPETEVSNSPSTSSSIPTKTLEERLAARDERLKKLEGQCKALVSQVTNTSHRSVAICNKLEDLHEIYGETSTRNANTQNPTDSDQTQTQSENQDE